MKTKLNNLGDIDTKLPAIVPEVGDFIFVIETTGIADPRKREVLFRNRYGILCQWYEEILQDYHHRFFEFDFFTFRPWQDLEWE